MHNSWDKNDPLDAQVILHLLKATKTGGFHDPVLAGHNDLQEIFNTHAQLSKRRTRLLHSILNHYLPIYFPETFRCSGAWATLAVRVPALSLKVNGRLHAVVADGEMPLLWVLRDLLGLTGTKYGCGIGRCGACTVHVDDKAVRSCVFPVSSVGQRRITTIEGLAENDAYALIESWVAEQVPQCGYCQPGQIMMAAALLKENPDPTDAEIKTGMAGNLCRCGTYLRIRRAIRRAARSR